MSKPCIGPNGERFASQQAAAAALGVNVSTIYKHLSERGNLDMVGVPHVSIVHGKRQWSSIKAAAKALRVDRTTLDYHLRRYGNLDRLGDRGRRDKNRLTRIGPMSWPSRIIAAEALGLTTRTLRRWLAPNASTRQRERLLAAVMATQARRSAQ